MGSSWLHTVRPDHADRAWVLGTPSEEQCRELDREFPEHWNVVPDDCDELALIAKSFLASGGILPALYVTRDYENRPRFARMADGVRRLLCARSFAENTFAARHANSLRNLRFRLQKPIASDWQNSAEGCVVLVVGAGPSLDVSLPLIAKWNVPLVIIASDSAVSALRRVHLEPDLVVSVDPQKTPEQCGQKNDTPGHLVGVLDTHPDWFRAWGRRASLADGLGLMDTWLMGQGAEIHPLSVGQNAGLAAFQLANFLSPDAILLAGMDMSENGPSGMQHYSSLTGRPVTQPPFGSAVPVPGNFDEAVITHYPADWRETSAEIEKVAACRNVISFTDRGARFGNVHLIHPKESESLRHTLMEEVKPRRWQRPESALQPGRSEHLLSSVADSLERGLEEIVLQPELASRRRCLRELLESPGLGLFLGNLGLPNLRKWSQASGFIEEADLTAVMQALWEALPQLREAAACKSTASAGA